MPPHADLDAWLAKCRACEPLEEYDLKRLCGMVKELLVEGIATTYDVEVIDNGLRLPTMTDMTIHSKVMYTVKVLRGITRSIPSFVKYL